MLLRWWQSAESSILNNDNDESQFLAVTFRRWKTRRYCSGTHTLRVFSSWIRILHVVGSFVQFKKKINTKGTTSGKHNRDSNLAVTAFARLRFQKQRVFASRFRIHPFRFVILRRDLFSTIQHQRSFFFDAYSTASTYTANARDENPDITSTKMIIEGEPSIQIH